MIKRILACILIFCTAIGFVPTLTVSVGAQETATQTNVQTASPDNSKTTLLGTVGMAHGRKTNDWSGSYVYFGDYNGSPMRFRVLQSSTTQFSENGKNTTMLLDCDSILFSSKFDDSSCDWKDSLLRNQLNSSFLNGSFSAYERNAIAHSIKSSPTEKDEQAEIDDKFVPLDDDVFLLDIREILTDENGYYAHYMLLRKNSDNDLWWLRSKGSNYDNITYWPEVVDPSRYLNFSRHKPKPSDEYGVSPALNIDLSDVLFSNLISGEPGEERAEYALTVINEEQFSAKLPSGQSIERDGNRLKIPYCAKTDGSDASLKLLLLDKPYEEGNANGAKILLNESLVRAVDGESSYIYYNLPDEFSSLICGKDYYSYLIVEQDSDNNKETVCASKPYNVTIPALTRIANLGTRSLFVSADGWSRSSGTMVFFGEYDMGYGTEPCLFRVLQSSPETQEVSSGSLLLDSNSPFASMGFHDSSTNWNDSTVKQWLEQTLVPSFSRVEQSAILPTTLLEKNSYDISESYGTLSFRDYASENNRMFLLSAEEVSRLYVDNNDRWKNGKSSTQWFVRSASTKQSNESWVVNDSGVFLSQKPASSCGVSPAFNLDASKILLTTTNLLDKSQPITSDSEALATSDKSDWWRLTLLDDRKSVQVTDGFFAGADNGKIYVPYSYTDSAENDAEKVNQISVMITDYPYADSRAQVLHYGALQDITDENGNPSDVSDAKNGVGSFCLPNELAGKKLGTDYYIYIIAEHTENNDKTDLASEPAEVMWICSTGGVGSYTTPTEKGGLLYNGAFQDLVNYGTVTSGAEYRYSLDGKEWTQRAIAVNGGDYSVYRKLIDSATGEDLCVWSDSLDARIALLTVTDANGDVSYHLNLPDAMANAQDGAVIRLHGDVIDDTFNLSYKFSGDRNVTIDLNGQTLRCKRSIETTMSSLTFVGDGIVDTPIDFDGGYFYCKGGIFLKQVTLYKASSGGQLSGGYFSRLAATTITLRNILADGYEFFRDGSVYGFSQNNVAEEVLVAPKASAANIKVTYLPNGGTGDMEADDTKSGKAFSVPECEFVRDGYVFSGWNTEADGSGKSYMPGGTAIIAQDISLYAQWLLKKEYTVTFDANGGEGQMNPQTFYAGAAQKLNSLNFARRRYNFTGWNTSPNGGGAAVSDGQLLLLDCDITLYAQWTADPNPTYYATVRSSGGGTASASPQSGTRGIQVTLTAKPDEDCYLKEWKIVSGGIQIDENDQFRFSRDDVVIEAVFAEIPENQSLIRFDANGGSGKMKDMLAENGTEFALPKNVFVNGDLAFAGWNTEKDGSGTSYEDAQTIKTDKNLTLYAQWRRLYTFSVTFNANGGNGTMPEQSFTEGKGGTLNANAFSREGYTFIGWNTKSDGSGTDYAEGETITVAENTVLYAMWWDNSIKRYSVTVTANCDGANVSADVSIGASGTLVHLTAEQTVLNLNYGQLLNFSYWKVISGDVEVINDSFVIGTSDVHIQAVYESGGGLPSQGCQITYNTNFGTNPMEYSGGISLQSATVEECRVRNPGYVFAGWNTKKNGSGMTLAPGQKIKFYGSLTLYAQWECEKHSGGTATCKDRAVCEICGKGYGELNPNKHTGTTEWIHTATTHTQKYKCCGAIVVAEENHEWENGICTECGYECSHTGGAATCKEKAVCEICGEKYGELAPHSYSEEWSTNDTTHWHECTVCGAKADEAEHIDADKDHKCDACKKALSECADTDNDHKCDICGETLSKHTGGTATCKDRAVCEICGEKYGELAPHSYSEEWSTDDTTHWHECTACGAKADKAEHIDADKDHKCDACKKALSECADTDNDHKCDICGETLSKHSGGAATCKEKAVCEICGEKYGELAPHSYSGEWSTDDTTHWHKCTVCGAKTDEAEHIDTDKDHRCDACEKALSKCADDDKDHKCDVCKRVLSECADTDNDHKCDICGETLSKHSGGTATCKDKAVCEICGEKYGELNANNHTDLKHIDAKEATESAEGNIEYRYCSGCGKYYMDAAAMQEITPEQTVTAKLPSDNNGSAVGNTADGNKPDNNNPVADATNSPNTGDNSNMMLWIALLLISGGAVAATTVYGKKKNVW